MYTYKQLIKFDGRMPLDCGEAVKTRTTAVGVWGRQTGTASRTCTDRGHAHHAKADLECDHDEG